MKLRCRKCRGEVSFDRKIGFRELCPNCDSYLHSCAHCRFHEGDSNRCAEPQAEKVRDPEGGNFCEFFQPAPDSAEAGSGSRDEADALWTKLTGGDS